MDRRSAVGVLVSLLLGACAAPATMKADRLAEVQRMADEAARAYGRPLARVQVAEVRDGWVAQYTPETRTITLSEQALWYPDWWFWRSVAHEIAHHVLGHSTPAPTQEIEADLHAVVLLQRFRGMTEADATDLLWQSYCNRRGERAPAPGHPPIAAKMAAFQTRYGSRSCVR